jgi:hypothetical protein
MPSKTYIHILLNVKSQYKILKIIVFFHLPNKKIVSLMKSTTITLFHHINLKKLRQNQNKKIP